MIRLAHFSDVHLSSPELDWTLRDWFSKRLTSWGNYRFLGRAIRFTHAEDIVPRLMDDLIQREVDHLIFSGDATALGFESEIQHAAEALRVAEAPIPGLAIPGNHDYCTWCAANSGHFERHFAPWQQGRRIDGYHYPFAQPVGPIWLIAVNAATGNTWPWDAGGSVDAYQLARLRRLLAELEPGLRILVLHFPICLSNGNREPFYHGLRGLDALLDIANAGNVNLWLHGHRHTPYHCPQPAGANFPAICAGSATQNNLWSYGEYTIGGNVLSAVRRAYDPADHTFQEVERFQIQLMHSVGV
jgi:3',5'-cyclic AMP phosphodiesterase CpdA